MGAGFFVDYSDGKDAKDAYSKAVKKAEIQYGNDPYNSTISTTDGFFMITVDGNRKNNKEENLILLCPNCHSLTENYRYINGKNRNASIV